jgi:hypothetical protein
MVDQLKYHHKLNTALDQELTEQEWEALNNDLADSPEVAAYWERLRRVDRLLHETPLAAPSAGFTSRVMAAIAAIHLPDHRRLSVGIGLGLGVAAILIIPLLSAGLLLLLSVITDPGTYTKLLQAITGGVSYLVDLGANLGSELETLVTDTPMIPALLSTAIPISMVWGWLVWYLSGHPKLPTRR